MYLLKIFLAFFLLLTTAPVMAQSSNTTFSSQELVKAGHGFFGQVSGGIASGIEYAVSKWGKPNGYVLGEEASGSLVVGARYGEGQLNTKLGFGGKLYWQGPSVGFDFGGDGNRTMMLVYNLKQYSDMNKRFGGVTGSAYFVGGVGLSAYTWDGIVVVPIRSGIGVRLGVNASYIKFTPKPDWNPF